MVEITKSRIGPVIGPDGAPITIDDLPPPSTTRWTIRRKATVVAAVLGNLISLDEACSCYALMPVEFSTWQDIIEQHGMLGLRATRVQQYRS